jgi:hypothetical protein
MKARLILSLNGVYLTEVDVELPGTDENLSWQDNIKIRESYVHHEAEKMRIRHLNAILKYKGVFEIVLIIPSKMNQYEESMDYR